MILAKIHDFHGIYGILVISMKTIEIFCFIETMLFHRIYGILVIPTKSIEICCFKGKRTMPGPGAAWLFDFA